MQDRAGSGECAATTTANDEHALDRALKSPSRRRLLRVLPAVVVAATALGVLSACGGEGDDDEDEEEDD
jgi:hypothetical protein